MATSRVPGSPLRQGKGSEGCPPPPAPGLRTCALEPEAAGSDSQHSHQRAKGPRWCGAPAEPLRPLP